jgi:DNA-binding CsgD family transcriptional regulator
MSRAQEKSRLAMIDAMALEGGSVRTIDEYKEWTREKIRPVFAHEGLGSGYGHLHAGGVALDYVVTVDFPSRHLYRIRNRTGAIDTPILRRWLATREPQLFEADRPWPDAPAAWLESFHESGLENTAAHGVYDVERCVGTYHSFHRIPGRLGAAHAEALKRIVPVMHEVLCRVIDLLRVDRKFATRLACLSSREREMAQWAKSGRTNSKIASLSGASENTVKHHLTRIFGKLAVENRGQLVQRLAEYEAKAALGSGTKIL